MRTGEELQQRVYLGIDIGTTSLRACAFDGSGNMRSAARRELNTVFLPDGRVEQDPHDWERAMVGAVREAVQISDISRRVAGIGVATTCPTLLPVHDDEQWTPREGVRAQLWLSNHAAAEADELRNELGLRLSSEAVAPKLLWFARNQPEVLNGRLVECSSWIVKRLCRTEESSCVSRTIRESVWFLSEVRQLFAADQRTRRALEAIDIPVLPATERAGELHPDVMRDLGIESKECPVVAVGGNDGLLSAWGAGMLASPSIVEIFGSSGLSWGRSDKEPEPVPGINVWGGLLEDRSFVTVSSIETAGPFLNKLRELLCMERDEFRSEMRLAARQLLAGELRLDELPHVEIEFLGQKSPWDSDRGGGFSGITPLTTRTELILGCLNTIAWEAEQTAQAMLAMTSPTAERLILAGGFSRNPAFRAIRAIRAKSAKSSLPIDVVRDRFVACRGAAMCAASAAGSAGSFEDVVEAFVPNMWRLSIAAADRMSGRTRSST